MNPGSGEVGTQRTEAPQPPKGGHCSLVPCHSQMATLLTQNQLLFGCVCTEAGGRQRSAIHRDLFRSGFLMSGDVMNLSGFSMAAGFFGSCFSMLLLFPEPGYEVHTSPLMST